MMTVIISRTDGPLSTKGNEALIQGLMSCQAVCAPPPLGYCVCKAT